MAIRRPNLSVKEARHLASARTVGLAEFNPAQTTVGEETNVDLAAAKVVVPKSSRQAEATKQVFLSAPLPVAGRSKSFDYLSRQYSPEKALRMILRRALDDYEYLLESGDFKDTPLEYTTSEGEDASRIIQTSRVMSTKLLGRARAFFDPLGFESERAFGRKLACAALAAFFSLEATGK